MLFFIYENLNKYLTEFVERNEIPHGLKLLIPFFSSSIAELSTVLPELPFDILRTRL